MPARTAIPAFPHRQRGAAFMVMLVVLIVGITAIFVTSLNGSSFLLLRNAQSADALSKARDALIGYAAKDLNRPGELPCPDFNNDGESEPIGDYNGSNCKSLVGWLPWKSLGLVDLRDANGDRLWYAVADPFRAKSSAILNNDAPVTYSAQMLSINDGVSNAVLESGIVAIVFSPGVALTGTRTAGDNNATNALPNYLEGDNANLDTVFKTANDQANPAVNPVINDRLLTINASALLQPVEMRIARETRSCLEQYAGTSGSKYPWAAPITSSASYIGQENLLFGRIPDTPNVDITTTTTTPGTTTINPIDNSADPNYAAISSALTSMRDAIDACDSSGTQNAMLQSAATALQTAIATAPTPPYTAAFLTNANSLISMATAMYDGGSKNACQWINDNGTFEDNIKDQRRDTRDILLSLTVTVTTPPTTTTTTLPASGMLTTWPAGCFASTYWPNWKNNVFYQVDTQYKPNGTLSTPSLTIINSTGNYRAMVLVARKALSGVVRATADSTTYLENINRHQGAITTTFETYNPSDVKFITVNDLVLCLDGSANCMQ